MNNERCTTDAPPPKQECEFCEDGHIPTGSWHKGVYYPRLKKYVNFLCQMHLTITVKDEPVQRLDS